MPGQPKEGEDTRNIWQRHAWKFLGGKDNPASKQDTSADAELIRRIAREVGIDPNTAVAVARSEGLGRGWSGPLGGATHDKGTSFGPLQAHFSGPFPGLTSKGQGDMMLKAGIDARDPKNKEAVLRWQLRYAKQHGWSEWHGAAAHRIGNWQGISGVSPSTSTTPTEGHLAPNIPKPGTGYMALPEFKNYPGLDAAVAISGADTTGFHADVLRRQKLGTQGSWHSSSINNTGSHNNVKTVINIDGGGMDPHAVADLIGRKQVRVHADFLRNSKSAIS